MTKITVCLALAGLVATGAAARGDGSGVFPYDTRVETLDNGLKVILVPMSAEGLASFWAIVRTGSRDEFEPGHTGFAHFFEHMAFRGTKRFPADAYNDKMTELGADTNAFTSTDLTAYYANVAAEDLPVVLDLESDRFKNLSYTEPAFRTEAGAVYGEYRKGRTNPFFVIYEATRDAAFKVHTYGHTTMGYVEDIRAMPTMFDYSQRFFDRYYRPENTVLLISGDFDPQEVLDQVRKYFGDWEPGYVAPEVPAEPEQTEERRVDVTYEGRSLPIVWVAYKAPGFDPRDRAWAASHLISGLYFGETSALYKKLVLDEHVVEFLDASLDPSRDPGLMDILSRVKDPEKVDYVLEEIEATIAQAQEAPPDQQRLADIKSRLKYEFLMGLDTPQKVNGALAGFVAATGGIEAVDTLFATIDAVTADDVQAAASQVLIPARRTVAVLRGES